MKTISFRVLIAFFIFFCYGSSCTKQSNSPTNVLPPLTNKGLNTIGCIVNGKLFIPQRPIGDITPFFSFSYRNFYSDTARFEGISFSGTDKNNSCDFGSLGIRLDSVKLQAGTTYNLMSGQDSSGLALPDKQAASYISVPSCSQFIIYNTTDLVTGQITITFLDRTNRIVSGTFWYDAIDNSNDTVHIREGRFDMSY